ncbi:MAG: hypothetical protein II931_03950 [Clostridia bacterium]|nr:hypothetical protein [Clostridia bacterium]
MAKNENKNKIPGAAVAIVAVIVAVTVFVPTVYMPYKNKKPAMDSEHQEAVDTINYYEDSIANQASIEKDIDELEKEWAEFQKNMFVDAASSLDDLQKAMDDIGFQYTSFDRGSETADDSGKVSFTGSPLYYVSISINGYTDEETLLKMLKFIEEDSVGCYYVKSLNAKTYEKDEENDKYTIKAGDFEVDMDIYLYYYNQKITITPEETDTETETEE